MLFLSNKLVRVSDQEIKVLHQIQFTTPTERGFLEIESAKARGGGGAFRGRDYSRVNRMATRVGMMESSYMQHLSFGTTSLP